MENDLVDHVIRIKTFYQGQKDKMVTMVRQFLPDNVRFVEPQGGMFLWLTLPEKVNAQEVLFEAACHRIVFVPGENFYVANGPKNTIRLNYSNCTENQMERGLRILGTILKNFC
jgi:2-aminoadipate transaminase